jgi:hypothetical protein
MNLSTSPAHGRTVPMIRDMMRAAAARSTTGAHRYAEEAIRLEYAGVHKSYDCAHWWLGAVLHDFWARILGYRGPSLGEQLGRPPRPTAPPPPFAGQRKG